MLVKKIGQQFKEARLKAGISQKALADKVGISQPRIAELERGTGNPTLETLQSVARALRLNLDFSLTPKK